MTTQEAVLDSWDRACKALDNLIGRLTPEFLELKPSADGWTIAFHLAHLHSTRRFWHMKAAELDAPVGRSLYDVSHEEPIPSSDLNEIRERLNESAALVRNWVCEKLDEGAQQVGHYDHPALFLQHMIWHEGWHFALIMLALRIGGHEPPEEWEEMNVWDLWRLPG